MAINTYLSIIILTVNGLNAPQKSHIVAEWIRKHPWQVWLSGLSACLQTTGSVVEFPVRVHAWVAGQDPVRGTQEATTH